MVDQPMTKNGAGATPPEHRRRSQRRRVFKLAGILLVTASIAGLGTIFYLRSARFNRTAVRFIESKLRDYGMRAEVGSFGFTLNPQTARLKDLRIYNEQSGRQIATIARIDISAEVREPFALRRSREIVLKEVGVTGLELHVSFDRRGASNFDGLKSPAPESGSILVDTSRLAVALTDSRVHYFDERIDLGIDLEGMKLLARRAGNDRQIGAAGLAAASETDSFGIELMAGGGRIGFEGREAPIKAVNLSGTASGTGMTIANFRIDANPGTLEGSGRLGSWAPFSYKADFSATARLGEITRLFAPQAGLEGAATCRCRIESSGDGDGFAISGDARSDRMGIDGARLVGVELPGAIFQRVANHFKFSTVAARAARVEIGEISLRAVAVSSPRGTILDGRTVIESARGMVGSVEWPKSLLQGLTLSPLRAEFADRRYLVTAEARLNEGSVLGVDFKQASARARFDPRALNLDGLRGDIDGGSVDVALTIPLRRSEPFVVDGRFTDLPSRKIFSLLEIERMPISGTVTGETSLRWFGGEASTIGGSISAEFRGGTPTVAGGLPLSGQLKTVARDGIFTFSRLDLTTEQTAAHASGTLAVSGESDLEINIDSKRATELIEIARAFDELRPLIEEQVPYLPRRLTFTGRLNGDLSHPVLVGDILADPIGRRGIELGALSGQLRLNATDARLANAILKDPDGGVSRFELALPLDEKASSGFLKSTIDRPGLTRIIRAFAADGDGELADIVSGKIAGEVSLTGLPGRINGTLSLRLTEGQIAGMVASQPVESATATISFVDHRANLENFTLQLPQTTLQAGGSWNLVDDSFSINGQASRFSIALLAEAFGLEKVDVRGSIETTFAMTGRASSQSTNPLDWQNLSFNLRATTSGLRINDREVGDFRIYAGTNATGRIRAILNTSGTVERELLFATMELKDRRLPLTIGGDLKRVELAPFIALLAPEQVERISGTVSGRVSLSGPMRDEAGQTSAAGLRGELTLSELELNLSRNRLRLATPIEIRLAESVVTLPATRITGPGVEIDLDGKVGLAAVHKLSGQLRGKIDLDQIAGIDDSLTTFGTLMIEAQSDGTIEQPNLSGAVDIRNLGISMRDLPFFLSNGNGLITLAGNRLEINSFQANANDGRLEAKGTIQLDGLDKGRSPSEWRIEFRTEKAEIYLRELSGSLSGSLVLAGTPDGQTLSGLITASRLEYDSQINLDDLISGGGQATLDFDLGSLGIAGSGGSSLIGRQPTIPTRFDLRLEARDSLSIRGEQISAVGTALLNVTGSGRDPNITGRLESDSGYVRFRGQRYEISRATLDLLPGTNGTVLNLIAESEFSGYRVSLGLAGQIDAIDTTLRSEPALSRDEIVALITTGRTETRTLSNQDPLRSGVGAAASILSSGLISRPTEQLLGLSRFQIDPIIRPNANPAARLTVGQQLSRNFYVSYSTNLATEQDQTALAEYTFSNRFSGLATYTQGGSSTRQGLADNVFTIEMRGRQRFSLGFIPDLPVITGATGSSAGVTTPAIRRSAPEKLPAARVQVTQFDGLRLREKRLRELLPVMNQGFSRSLARLGERRLREYLQEQGYFFAEVRFRCEPIDCGGSQPKVAPRVFYDIEPNRIYELKEIRIEGSDLLRIDQIRGELKCETASRVGGIPFFKDLPLIGGSIRGLTSNERLKSDEELIRRKLVDQGYLRARVSSRLAVRPENDDLLLIFNVEPGPLSRVDEVTIEGNLTIPMAELRAAIPVQSGLAFSPNLARLGAQQLRQIYANRGYLEAVATLEVEEKSDDRLKLRYLINEGVQAIVSQIEIAGTTRTGISRIRRYYDFKPGEILTPEKLRATQSALNSTNAFREVNLRFEPVGGDNGAAHKVTVNLTEAKPLLFVYGLGYSSDDGIRGSLELANTNLRGRLNSLTMRLRASSREQISQISFTDLRPLGFRIPTTISVFYNRTANLRTFIRRRIIDQNGQAGDSTDGGGFGLDRYGTFIQIEKRVAPRTSLRFRYNFERASLFGIDETQFKGTEVTRNERAIRLGMLSIGISRDTRDNVLNPSRGQLISADHSLAAVQLGGNESFNKFFSTFQRYRTIESDTPILGRVLGGTTLAFAARLGLAGVFRTADRNKDGNISESEQRLPISERFFSGGATTLRGFRFENAGPHEILEARPDKSCDLPARPCDLPTLVPIGGDALAILNFELRYPLSERLRLVPFYDVGNVFRRVSDFSFSRLTHTVGFGLRINTPIGPVGVDYGLLLDPPAYQSTTGALIRQQRGVFHVRLGQSF